MVERVSPAAGVVSWEQVSEWDTEVLAIADNESDPAWHLEFQVGLEFDAQDKRLGMDTYCLVLDGGPTAYGCLASISVRAETMSLGFTEDGSGELGLSDREVEIPLRLDSTDLKTLTSGLRSILKSGPAAPQMIGF